MYVNSRMNADSELEPFKKRLESKIHTTQACTTLSKIDRMKISALQIYSCFYALIFLYVYLCPTKLEKVRRSINACFKKAAYFHMHCDSFLVEQFLFGMSFDNYVELRFLKVCNRMKIDKNPHFDRIFYNKKRKKWFQRPKMEIGPFIQKYILFMNSNTDYKALKKHQKATKLAAKRALLKYKPPIY